MSLPTSSYAYAEFAAAQARRTGSQQNAASVQDAVAQASQRTGVDFSYLMEKAAVESSFRTDLKASSSSATGLYQFIDSTWLETLKAHGAQHGYGREAAAIQRGESGRLFVADPAQRSQIMELRKDPKASALMVAELTRDNAQYLQSHVGGQIGKTELYMAHFLGPAGASKFLNAYHANPGQVAKDLFPDAAASNPGVFLDRQSGRPTTLGQIYARFAGKFDGSSDGSLIGAAGGGWGGLDAARGSASLNPLAGHNISMYTMLALAALETPLDNRQSETTAFGSRRVGAGKDQHQTGANEFQQRWRQPLTKAL